MDQVLDYADDRLIDGCIYCGDLAETRDHVPSRILLEPPYPENLPVVGACKECNQGFSSDEQYFVCLLESALVGSTNPDKIRRPSVARAMKRAPALRSRIELAKRNAGSQTIFDPEEERVRNVILKLARGHAAFELSQACREEPNHFLCCPTSMIDDYDTFEAAHIQSLVGEVGSRNMQRMKVMEAKIMSLSGKETVQNVIVNDWINVQEGYYHYLAVHDMEYIMIRIVIANYLACEVIWETDT